MFIDKEEKHFRLKKKKFVKFAFMLSFTLTTMNLGIIKLLATATRD